METAVAIVAAILVLVVLGLAVWLRARLESQTSAMRQEMQSALQAHVQPLTGQVNQFAQLITQQLGQVNQTLQQGVADSGSLVRQAHEVVSVELKNSREMLNELSRRLGEMQLAGQQLSDASRELQQILGGAKSRGTLGEMGLERLLEDALPRSAFDVQYRFAAGTQVDAVIRVGEKLLSVDSKFPLDAYRRLVDDADAARKDFAQDVRKHADSIASKYILPDEATLDFALMFVPSETVFYELLMTEDSKGVRLDDYCRGKRVIPVSPNTLHAYLSAILMGLRGMQVEENARKLMENLAGLEKQLGGFADVFDKLGTHLRNAQKSYDDAENKLANTRARLNTLAQGSLPEAAPKSLAPAAKD